MIDDIYIKLSFAVFVYGQIGYLCARSNGHSCTRKAIPFDLAPDKMRSNCSGWDRREQCCINFKKGRRDWRQIFKFEGSGVHCSVSVKSIMLKPKINLLLETLASHIVTSSQLASRME